MRERGRAVLMTGASGAIGGEAARRLAARGHRLALSGRRAERLEALAREIAAATGSTPAVLPADLARPGEAARLAEAATEALGAVDVLVNNAGGGIQALTWTAADREPARAVFETNLWSPLALVGALVPGMLARGGGAVVNVGSLARISPFPHLGHYAASRAAIATATQVLELELRPRGIRVVELALGVVDTPASRRNRSLAGAEQWLDGPPRPASVAGAASAMADAVDGDAEGVVVYPRSLRWVHRLPGLGRRFSRRAARGADLGDESLEVDAAGAPASGGR